MMETVWQTKATGNDPKYQRKLRRREGNELKEMHQIKKLLKKKSMQKC